MCGIVGTWSQRAVSKAELGAIADRMGRAIAYRGPDDAGVWVDEENGLALGHRRLSIIDLSPMGHQPMVSAHGRYVITFNGEVYNFAELRKELEARGCQFRGHSDTEVMLAAFEEWGVEAAVRRFVGMFAFALWDRSQRVLHLVRDRLGIKPLYFGWAGNTLLFASELKAFHEHPEFEGEIDRDVVALFLRYGYVPAPYAIYRRVYKLAPGCLLSIPSTILDHPSELSALPEGSGAEIRPMRYWSAKQVAEKGCGDPFRGSEEEAADRLEELLNEAISLRMIADVPLGAFLSGGIDSSTIVALMQAQSSRPVKTFTIGYQEAGYDESRHAAAVARHLGTDHTALEVTPEMALEIIPRLPVLADEPFADVSMIPTFLLCELTRRSVTVSLSGDGGDELFGGYHRYFYVQRIAQIPPLARRFMAKTLSSVPPHRWQALFQTLRPVLSERMQFRLTADKPFRIAEMLGGATEEAILLGQVSHWNGHCSVVLDAKDPCTAVADRSRWASVPGLREQMMHLDLVTFLPDSVLTKTDRASMATSLEARVPMLDHRVVEFAWRLPSTYKIQADQIKCVLRRILYRYVPHALVDRPKMGFSVPVEPWLRGPLREWASELLDETRLKQEGIFDPKPITRMWQQHLSGAGNWRFQLWPVLTFQAWKEAWS